MHFYQVFYDTTKVTFLFEKTNNKYLKLSKKERSKYCFIILMHKTFLDRVYSHPVNVASFRHKATSETFHLPPFLFCSITINMLLMGVVLHHSLSRISYRDWMLFFSFLKPSVFSRVVSFIYSHLFTSIITEWNFTGKDAARRVK